MLVILMQMLIGFLLAAGSVTCFKKKGDEAAKLKPREMNNSSNSTPATPEKEKEKSKIASIGAPVSKGPVPMPQREADDNETINDAKSDWGAVQQ